MRHKFLIPWMLLNSLFVTSAVDAADAEPRPKSPETTASAERGAWFLEIVSESSDRPFHDDETHLPPASHRLLGYLFDSGDDGSVAKLYPATGSRRPDHDEVEFYLGYRILDLSPEPVSGLSPADLVEHRSLLIASEDAFEFSTGTVATEELRKARAMLAANRPGVTIGVKKQAEGMLLSLKEREFLLKPGDVQILLETSNKVAEGGTAYHRLKAAAHGEIQVASFDALHQWRRSQQLLTDGPYVDALEATERVLLADPAHKAALAQWKQLQSLLESGKTASVLQVELRFASNLDAKAHLQRWKQKPTGLIYLSTPDAPAGEALAGRMIDADEVSVPVPSGRYRVTLLLPGFRQFQQEIEINGRTKLEIPIEK